MPDHTPEQLTLFQTSIDYSLRLTTSNQSQDWPLPAAASLEEAIDATRGFGLFLMFNQGILWGEEWEVEDAYSFRGFDQHGNPVRLAVEMQDSYTDQAGNRL
jgi:hypothetical protein